MRHPVAVPRIPLPLTLATEPFRVAAARDLDVGRGRLRGPDLARPFHGVRSGQLSSRALAYVPLLRPGDRFSHTSAAELWPLPLPPGHSDVHVTATPPRNPPRGRRVLGHVSNTDTSVIRFGLPLSDPVALFLELATILGEDDLVAVGDALVLDPEVLDPLDLRPWVDLGELREGCRVSRARGSRLARRAVARVRCGSESREETLLRLLIVAAGIPEPSLQQEVRDRRGRWIGRFDMVYRDARVIVEYDGDQHRTSTRQYEKDIGRLERAFAAGWTVVRVRARGLYERPDVTIRRVRSALGI